MNRHLSASHRVAKLAALLAVAGAAAWPIGSTPAWAQDEDLDGPATMEDAGNEDLDAAPTEDTEAPEDSDSSEAPSSPVLSEAVPLAPPSDAQKQRAANIFSEAITVAYRNPEARVALARGGAALLPRLESGARMGLANRWVPIISTSAVPREVRLSAFSAFFDVASRTNVPGDIEFARDVAMMVPDASARAGAFVRLSEAAEKTNWEQAAEFGALAQRAARQENSLPLRARALAYISTRLASLNPETREAAVIEASSQARLISTPRLRDSLLAEIVGGAAKFDIGLAQRISDSIEDPTYKNLATARIAVSQTQASMATKAPDSDRIATIVNGVQRYDSSFIPVLLQLPASPDVFQALATALPPIYPGAPRAIDASTLERVWNFTRDAEPSVYRDQLQSRVARLMVLHDLWRGREWGQQLAWQGGRDQISEFVEATVRARESDLQTEQLRVRTVSNVNSAILSTRNLSPASRVEGLLLIAGQVLSGSNTPMPVEA